MPGVLLLGIFITVRELLLIVVTPPKDVTLVCYCKVVSVPTDDLNNFLRDLDLHWLSVSLLKEGSC